MTDNIVVDFTRFVDSARQHIGRDWPSAVVVALSEIAEIANRVAQSHTAKTFDLHSDYVTKGIRYYPKTPSQIQRAKDALSKYGDANAAVYIRPSGSPKYSLDFMVDHELGEQRKPTRKYIAVPTRQLRQRGYRTARGVVRKSLRPGKLLSRYNASSSRFDGSTTISSTRAKARRSPGSAFLIQGAGGIYIARRLSKSRGRNLEFLYLLRPTATIRRDWGLVRNVWGTVASVSTTIIKRHTDRMPSYE